MINDEMPIDMFRKMMEQLKRIEKQLQLNRVSNSQYLTISERSKSNFDLKINIGNSQISSFKINLNEVIDHEEGHLNEEKQELELSSKRDKQKNSRVQRNQQKFQPISRVLNTVQIEPNSPIQYEDSNTSSSKCKFTSQEKIPKNVEQQSLPLASSYFELSESKLDSQALPINQGNSQKIQIDKNDITSNSNLGKEVTFPLCLQTPIKAITEGAKMTSESRRNIEQLQSIANRNKLLFSNKMNTHYQPQQSNKKWAVQSASKILKQENIMKPQKGYSQRFNEKNRFKQTPAKVRTNERYNTVAYEDEPRLNYNPRKSVSKEKLNQYFSKRIEEGNNNVTLPMKTVDTSFQLSRKEVLLKLRKRNNFQNSLRSSSKQAVVPYIHIKTTQKKTNVLERQRQPKRQRSSSIEQITQRLHSGRGKDPCLRFRDRSNSLLKDQFNKLIRNSSLAKRNMDKQDRETLYQQLRKSKESQAFWPSIITNKALQRAKSKRRQNV